MTIFARLLPSKAALRSALTRKPILVAVVPALCLLMAAPAGAVVSEVEISSGKFTTVGAQPRNAATVLDGGLGADFGNPSGNPVVHGSITYVVYWDPGDEYHKEWQGLINKFMQAMGAESGSLGNVFAVDAQYTDKTNQPAQYATTFRGAYIDDAHYPTSDCTPPHADELGKELGCLTNAQIQSQLQSFIAANNLPKGMDTIYYLLTPPGLTVCVDASSTHCSNYTGAALEANPSYADSFCSYHSAINPDKSSTGDDNTVLYGVIPWTAGGEGSAELTHLQGFACQDGGFDPTSKPIEKKEKKKEMTEKEEEAAEKFYNEATVEEKERIRRTEELEGPHDEEPNQLGGTGEDGAYDTGLADLIINQIAVEQQNIVTDPLLNAWQGQDSSHLESTDECRNFFAGGEMGGNVTANESSGAGTLSNQALNGRNYYLNLAFNGSAKKLAGAVPCIGGVNLIPEFTAPNPVNAGDIVAFDGMESDLDLAAGTRYSAGGTPETTYATYTWDFGDGTPTVSGYAPGAPMCETPWLSPCAGSVFHTYQYGGAYDVTLTVKDVGGDTRSMTHEVTVSGPEPPSSAGGSTGGASGASSGSSTGQTSAGGSAQPSAGASAAPVASAIVTRQSLHSALHKGLVVRYSVNEQVAGRFEVLLSSATARRLGVAGAPATGLPAGTPAEVVIAKAILVTTKGGRSAVHIQFSKRTAARLARARKVSLLLRMIVRGAGAGSPTSTVLSSVTLG